MIRNHSCTEALLRARHWDQLQPSRSLESKRRSWYQTNASTNNKLITVVVSATKENNKKCKRGGPNLGVREGEVFLEEMICNESSRMSLKPGWSPIACTGLCKTNVNRKDKFPFFHIFFISYSEFPCLQLLPWTLFSPSPSGKCLYVYKIVSCIKPSLNVSEGWEARSLHSPNPLGITALGTHTIGLLTLCSAIQAINI